MPKGNCPQEETLWCPIRKDECEAVGEGHDPCIIVDTHSHTVALRQALQIVASLIETEDPEKRKRLLAQIEEIL